jgi:7-keto-8-aminopelargonate synthetase and related enzymes
MKKKVYNFSPSFARSFEEPEIYGSFGLKFNKSMEINEIPSVNFVLNDYLGLSNDKRLKRNVKVINDDLNPVIANGLIQYRVEEYLSRIFDRPVVLFPNVAALHLEIIPLVINSDDAILVDQYANSRLLISADFCKDEKYYVEIIRHNDIQFLEERLNELKGKYKRIWYLADSIYSSFGDTFPGMEIQRLLRVSDQFFVYIDDSNGMSWTGKNGRGFIPDYVFDNSNVIITASLSKGFGSNGAILVCHNEEMKDKVIKYAKSHVRDSLLKLAALSAVMESAKIHLTNEIYMRQSELQQKIRLFHTISEDFELPLVSPPCTPSAFFMLGAPNISQEICFHLLKNGYYLNVANYPKVPYNYSGIMANVTLRQTDNDIRGMLRIFKDGYDRVLMKRKLSSDHISKHYTTEKQFV